MKNSRRYRYKDQQELKLSKEEEKRSLEKLTRSRFNIKKKNNQKETKTSKLDNAPDNLNEFGYDTAKMIKLVSCNESDVSKYSLGSSHWHNFWVVALQSVRQQRFLPQMVTNLGKEEKGEEKKPIPRIGSKLSEKDNNNQINSSEEEIKKIAIMQNKFSNDSTKAEISHDAIIKATSDLTRSKQMYLVGVLEQLEDELGFKEENTKDENHPSFQSNATNKNPLKKSPTKRRARSSLSSLPGGVDKYKYGKSILVSGDDTIHVLRKIAVAMDTESFKKLNYDLTGVGVNFICKIIIIIFIITIVISDPFYF